MSSAPLGASGNHRAPGAVDQAVLDRRRVLQSGARRSRGSDESGGGSSRAEELAGHPARGVSVHPIAGNIELVPGPTVGVDGASEDGSLGPLPKGIDDAAGEGW